MKAIRNILGLAFIATVAAVLLIGAGSSEGKHIVKPLGDSAKATGGSLTKSFTGLGWVGDLAGNAWAGVGVAAVLALALILLVPAVGSSTGRRAAAVLAAAVVGFVVYQPTIIGGGA